MTGKLKDLTMNRDGTQNITVTISEDFREKFDELREKDISIEIKKLSRGRSLTANNYFWHLCGEIAKASSKFSADGKNEIYRDAIREKGEWEPLAIKEEAIPRFIEKFSEKGTGWFAEVIDDYRDEFGNKMEGYKLVHAYYGSSTYDSASMCRIIDFVVMQAEELGIPTITENEKEKMLAKWGIQYEKKYSKKEDEYDG